MALWQMGSRRKLPTWSRGQEWSSKAGSKCARAISHVEWIVNSNDRHLRDEQARTNHQRRRPFIVSKAPLRCSAT